MANDFQANEAGVFPTVQQMNTWPIATELPSQPPLGCLSRQPNGSVLSWNGAEWIQFLPIGFLDVPGAPFQSGDLVVSIDCPDDYRMVVDYCEQKENGQWLFKRVDGTEGCRWFCIRFRKVTTEDLVLEAQLRTCVRCGCEGDGSKVSRFKQPFTHMNESMCIDALQATRDQQ